MTARENTSQLSLIISDDVCSGRDLNRVYYAATSTLLSGSRGADNDIESSGFTQLLVEFNFRGVSQQELFLECVKSWGVLTVNHVW